MKIYKITMGTIYTKNSLLNYEMDIYLRESSNIVIIDKKNLLFYQSEGRRQIFIQNHIHTIKIKEKYIATCSTPINFSYLDFLSFLHPNIKNIIFDSGRHTHINIINLLCDNLPPHIEYIELKLWANEREVFPHLNNLPINLKFLKIKDFEYISNKEKHNPYECVIVENNVMSPDDILLKVNIKLPFGCKIILPNKKTRDSIDGLFFKLKKCSDDYLYSSNINYNDYIINENL
jgi:hypothetical protein